MSEPARSLVYTFRDYVELEAYSNVRHEFRAGSILAMPGGTPEHAALSAAISGLLLQSLMGKRCVVHSSDLRVRVPATGLATYPDASVVCGARELDPDDRNTVINPKILIEVTSPSSEEYDRGEKREQYQQIASLAEYVVLSHRERYAEIWRRTPSGWVREEIKAGGRLELMAIDTVIELDRVYDLAAQAD